MTVRELKRCAFTLPWPPSLNRTYRAHGRGVHKSDAATGYAWLVIAALNDQDVRMLTGDVVVRLDLYRPAKRGDVDNYSKVLLDQLQGRVFADDSQVVELHIVRHDDRVDPRVEVVVEEVSR
jgi:Holliday junction resolvase RusA-like endonuclease